MGEPDIERLDAELNEMIARGELVKATSRFCSDDVVMQENSDPPRKGLELNLEYERQLEAQLVEFQAECNEAVVEGDTSFSAWSFKLELSDGTKVQREQVALRKWKDGKLVFERFYYAP